MVSMDGVHSAFIQWWEPCLQRRPFFFPALAPGGGGLSKDSQSAKGPKKAFFQNISPRAPPTPTTPVCLSVSLSFGWAAVRPLTASPRPTDRQNDRVPARLSLLAVVGFSFPTCFSLYDFTFEVALTLSLSLSFPAGRFFFARLPRSSFSLSLSLSLSQAGCFGVCSLQEALTWFPRHACIRRRRVKESGFKHTDGHCYGGGLRRTDGPQSSRLVFRGRQEVSK